MKKSIVLGIAAAVVATAALAEGCACQREKAKKEIAAAEAAVAPQPDSVAFFPDMIDARGVGTIHKAKGQTVYVFFDSDGHTRVSATLSSSDPAANVRFSQIIMPDGEADGPFGAEVDYELKQQGRYALAINENIMAGDPWEGEFSVSVRLDGETR